MAAPVHRPVSARSAPLPVKAAVLATALALAGCARDAPSPPAASPSPSEPAGSAPAALETYCGAILQLETRSASLQQATSPEQARAYFEQELRPLLDEARDSVPEENRANLELLAEGTERVVAGEDVSDADARRYSDAEEASHAYDVAHCGWARIDVTGTDYAYAGVPPAVAAGPAAFDLRNAGDEVHEMVVFRRKPGVTDTLDQLLAIEDEDEAAAKIEPAGFVDGVMPGESDYMVVDLPPGEYAMVCFYPVGTTPEQFDGVQEGAGELEGEPHFLRGMKTEFRVAR